MSAPVSTKKLQVLYVASVFKKTKFEYDKLILNEFVTFPPPCCSAEGLRGFPN